MTACDCHTLSHDRAIKHGTENQDPPEILPPEFGHFSRPFYRRTRFAIELAPSLVQHVMRLFLAQGQPGELVQGTREAPLPFNTQAWDDANEVFAVLVYWARAWSRELRIQPPGPAAQAWQNAAGSVRGLPSGITPDQARYITGATGLWLRLHLESIMNLDPEDVTLFHDNVVDVFRVAARWPQKDRAKWSNLPCPVCGGRLAIWPSPDHLAIGKHDGRGRPIPAGGERRIVCEVCENSYTDDEYQAEIDRVATATKTAQALVLKYGRQIPGEWRS